MDAVGVARVNDCRAVSRERLFKRRTSDAGADGEVVWSWRPDAGVKLAMMLCITPMTGARKPGPRGEYEGNR